MTGHDRYQQVSALTLVVLGGLLIVSGLVAIAQALSNGAWASAVLTAVLMALIGFGVLRGVRQLRGHRRSGPDEAGRT
jgi:hypothetical protein